MSVKEILIKTKDILNTNGWIQGKYRSECGVCLSEAIQEAGGETSSSFPEVFHLVEGSDAMAAHRFLESRLGMKLFMFNDYSFRTKEHIIYMLDEAIAAAP